MARMKNETPIIEGDVLLARKEARRKLGLDDLGMNAGSSSAGDPSHEERINIFSEERMAKKQEKYEKCKPVALEILEEARRTLAIRFRFLDAALWKMPLVPRFDLYGIASDGRAFYFDPVYVVDRYKLSFNEVVRDVIHCLFHCIFSHPFMLYSVLRQPWDVACDIAIETIIIDLVGDVFPSNMDRRAKESLHVLKAHVGGVITAERLYWFFGNEGNHTDLKSLAPMFYHDSHSLWYGDDDERQLSDGDSAPRAQDSGETREGSARQSLESEALDDIVSPEDLQMDDLKGSNGEQDSEEAVNDESGSDGDSLADEGETESGLSQSEIEDKEELADEWKDIAEHIQIELETHLAKRGEGAGSLIDMLRAVNREIGDYGEFLRRFATLHEEMRVNDDEFDYIYYKFGLDRYGNMPLIEPLEYKEDKRIHDFVIAIDTSESCSGEVVQAFMNKTYNILKETESFHDRVNIHIVQCDAAVQEDTKITSLDQLELYLQDFELKGFGGTDFRPVFDYVDSLIEKGELTDLRGLLYFTDGEGIYPRRPPAYDTAFVFLDDGYSNPEVPSWAIKTLLNKDSLGVEININ